MNIIIKWIIVYCILSYIINALITKIMIYKMQQIEEHKDILESSYFKIGIIVTLAVSPFTMPLMIYKVVLGKGV